MKIKPKYNIGDIAIVRNKDEYRISKITGIVIQGDAISYYLEMVAGKHLEEEISLYQPNVAAELKQQEALTNTTELPKTYEEALQLFNGNIYYSADDIVNSAYSYRLEEDEFKHPYFISRETAVKHIAFQKLIFLRDIYRQGWKPDLSKGVTIHTIVCYLNYVVKSFTSTSSRVLSFQSGEIRDEFYNNFKDLIEECKEFI